MNYFSMRFPCTAIVFSVVFFMFSCSPSEPNCGSSTPMHDLPVVLSEIGVPFDESSALCGCMNFPGGEFNVLLSHANSGGVYSIYETYEKKFLSNGFQLATNNETEARMVAPTSNASDILQYFYKDDLMIHCQVRDDIVHDGLQEVILRDVSSELIAPDFDLNAATKELDARYELLLGSLTTTDLSEVPTFTKEMLNGRSVLLQFSDAFENGTKEADRSEIYQRTALHNAADIIALEKGAEVPYDADYMEKNEYTEGFDDEGRKVTYFQGGSRSGTVYFMIKTTGEIIGKRVISASNSYQTSDPGQDLMNNYYNAIDALEVEFGAIDRSMH